MARIAIVGPGAIGGLVSAHLIKANHQAVILCARRPLSELILATAQGDIVTRPTVWTLPTHGDVVDWVFVTTKAYDAAAAAQWLPRLCSSSTFVAVLQNGVEHRERFAPYVPIDRIVPVMVDCPAERSDATHIRQRGPARMAVSSDAAGRTFAGLFADTDIAVELSSDFRSAIWRKLCLNSAGILSAITLKPAMIMHEEPIAELARGIVRECIAVGRAEGAMLDDSLVDSVIQSYRNAPPDSMNSLHADRVAGRAMEIDARNGVIVRLGQKHGIPTPLNKMAAVLLEKLSSPSWPS
jgi:2-dehydropantoate 2-reductase